jgi:hypothetical protein
VEAAIYSTKVILLKFFNLFDIDSRRTDAICEIPWAPSNPKQSDAASVVALPSTQNHSTSAQKTNLKEEIIDDVLSFPSICFTISQVHQALFVLVISILSENHCVLSNVYSDHSLDLKIEASLRVDPTDPSRIVRCRFIDDHQEWHQIRQEHWNSVCKSFARSIDHDDCQHICHQSP